MKPLRHRSVFTLGLAASAFVATATLRASSAPDRTALDRYVAATDTNYSWRVVNTIKGKGHTAFIVDLTSQAWLTTNEINQPLWKHWLTIVKPDTVAHSTGFLFINGGSNDKPAPTSADGRYIELALAEKTVVADLRMVPNQPLIFAGDGRPRTEDALIAYTWDKFLRTGDERWPARLPMTKSAVRAMDTVTALCASEPGGKAVVDKFVVAGGSKRGWTTWATAAVDKRVVAIVPFVIDLLNIEPSFQHHWEAYGFWAPAVHDYEEMKIMDWSGSPQYRALMRIEEPFEYRQRLTMPKFIINAAGDQFFLPDSSQFYFKELSGVKYLRYVPNTDHGLKNSDAWDTLRACYHAVLTGASLPKFSWTVEKDGSLRVRTETKPSEVKLWQATNPNARDFRLMTIGPAYTNQLLTDHGGGVFVGKVPEPEKGWTAFFVELTFPSTGTTPFKFTTDVRVVPDKLPFKYQQPTPQK
jgi:PhoPQ-activated pathogenicity-related protein